MDNRDSGFELHCLGLGSVTFVPYSDARVSGGSFPRTWLPSPASAVAELCLRLHVALSEVKNELEERNGFRAEEERRKRRSPEVD